MSQLLLLLLQMGNGSFNMSVFSVREPNNFFINCISKENREKEGNKAYVYSELY